MAFSIVLRWKATKVASWETPPKADYFAFKRLDFDPDQLGCAGSWDILLSSFDGTERVQKPFEEIDASEKHWVVHEEYGFAKNDYPSDAVTLGRSFDNLDVLELIDKWEDRFKGARVCIDATGFIRPHLLILLRGLRDIGVLNFDVFYSDPVRYVEDENTKFTSGPVLSVEQVPGYAGIHSPSGSFNDVLVIGAGYDYEQIKRACDAKRNSTKYVLTGLPSLQPHMYQESVLRIDQATESIGPLTSQQHLYASANHPFTVAQVLDDLLKKEGDVNLYLCPVGPKPHVIGFAIYYLRELEYTSSSIIYPFAEGYAPSTTQGIRRTWQYQVELLPSTTS